MKAIIMAGGEGTRLRPLTCDCPKPMVPVMDKPVMAYALQLLKSHGVVDVGVTLAYLPGQVQDFFGDGEEYGVRLQYFVEQTPLGTAGSVKQAAAMLDETFCVLSGDGLTDCDLSAALAFHQSSGAKATMVLKKLDEPLEYGVVVLEQDGRVREFVEKPGWGEVFSDTVNTGIYILEPEVLQLIPDGRPYDFGRELFPLLVQKGEPVFGHIMDGYWCDIGDIPAYLRAHMDAMDGRVKLIGHAKGAVVKAPGALIDRGAVLEGPCLIADGARVMQGAKVGPYAVVGEGSVVMPRASVKRSVIWRGATVGVGAQLRGCVIQDGSTAGEDCSMFEECVLANSAELGQGATLMPAVKVWPHKRVLPGERLDKNLIWGGADRQRYEGGRIRVCSPSEAVRGAEGYAAALKPGLALIGRDASIEALAYSRAAAAALIAQGVQLIDVGAVTTPQLRYTMGGMGAEGALYVGKDYMLPLGEEGLLISRADQRKLRAALMHEQGQSPFSRAVQAPVSVMRSDLQYIQMLVNSVDARAIAQRKQRVAVFAEDQQLLSLAERALRRCGLLVRAEWEKEMMDLDSFEIGVWLSSDGEQAMFSDAVGMIGEPERQMLLAWAALEDGAKKLIVPVGATDGILQLIESYGAQPIKTKSDSAEWLAQLRAEDKGQFRMHTDGLYAALQLIEHLMVAGLTLRGLLRRLPQLHRASRAVPVELRDKGALLRRLSEKFPDADLSDGIRLDDERGWAWVSPGGDLRQCMIVAESYKAELAGELCAFYSGELERLMKAQQAEKT